MLSEAVAAFVALLSPLTEADVPAQPPEMLGEYPMLIVYPQPGRWTPNAHTGENGRPVYGGAHIVVVEWHRVRGDLQEAVAETTTVTDAITEAIVKGFHADRIAGTLTTLDALRCESFGELIWGTDKTFGVRFLIDVTIYDEVPA